MVGALLFITLGSLIVPFNLKKIDRTMGKNDEPKVTGIGGIFFKSDNPQDLMKWYGDNLGLAIDGMGSPFEFRNANNPDEINYLRWGVFEQNTDYFNPSEKQFMINYRVQNIEALVESLKKEGVTFVDEITEYE